MPEVEDGENRKNKIVSNPERGDTGRDGKYFRDGHIVIVRNGVEYSVSGQMR